MRALVALALCTLLASGARGWPVGVGKQAPTSLAINPRGDVLAAIPVRLPQFSISVDIAKLDRIDGHLRWRHRLNGNGSEQSTEVGGLVLTRDGDPIVAGTIEDSDGESFLVARLAADSGSERWRSRLRGSQPNPHYNRGSAVAIDANGDVVVAGTIQNGPDSGDHVTYGDFAVSKLDPSTGNEQWRFTLAGPLIPNSNGTFTSQEADAEVISVDKAGNVIAAGEVFGIGSPGADTVSVVKVAGATGQLLWRRDLDIAWRSQAIALDPVGDVLLAASTTEQHGNDFGVVKLAGSTGQTLWVDRESGSDGRWQEAVRVLTDASGDVFASGMTDDGAGSAAGPDGYVFTVVRLDGTTGSRRWAYHTQGTAGGGFAGGLQFGAPGLLIAGGSIEDARTCRNLRIVALDANTGTLVWSRTFDGTYVQKFGCSSGDGDGGGGPGPPLDNDNLGAMVTDARGRVFAGIALTNLTSGGVRDFGSIRRLSAHR